MKIKPVHPDFGAEITDYAILHDNSPDTTEILRKAFDSYHLLIIRNAGFLTEPQQLEFACRFGPPPPVANEPGQYVSVLRNDAAGGRLALPFHSDLSYTAVPIKAICLNALKLPDVPTATTFTSGIAAWERLESSLQETLSAVSARHELRSFSKEYDWPDFIADHPVRLAHPRLNLPILYVTEHHTKRINEWDETQSRMMLDQLYAQLYSPRHCYNHWWEPGDLIIWDNLALQHARTEEANPTDGERALQRVSLSEVSLGELITNLQRER